MDLTELIQIINRDCYNTEETIQLVNELINEIDKDAKKFIYNLSNHLEEFSESKNKCPLCGSDIIIIDEWEEDRGEYLGQPCKEKVYKYGCESSTCNYIKD